MSEWFCTRGTMNTEIVFVISNIKSHYNTEHKAMFTRIR